MADHWRELPFASVPRSKLTLPGPAAQDAEDVQGAVGAGGGGATEGSVHLDDGRRESWDGPVHHELHVGPPPTPRGAQPMQRRLRRTLTLP